jgi:hypothetical protein
MNSIGLYLDFLAWLAVGVVIGYQGPRILQSLQCANADIERDLANLRNAPPPMDGQDYEHDQRRSA